MNKSSQLGSTSTRRPSTPLGPLIVAVLGCFLFLILIVAAIAMIKSMKRQKLKLLTYKNYRNSRVRNSQLNMSGLMTNLYTETTTELPESAFTFIDQQDSLTHLQDKLVNASQSSSTETYNNQNISVIENVKLDCSHSSLSTEI